MSLFQNKQIRILYEAFKQAVFHQTISEDVYV